MNKKLKLLIFVMSGIVVALLLGVLLLSVVSNLTSVEVYSFKLCATTASEINETDVNQAYTYYLSDIESENIVMPDFMNKKGENDVRMRYYFEQSDALEAEQVATILDEEGKYKLKLNKVGQITIDVYSGIYIGTETSKGTTYYGKYKIKVLKELYTINHVLSTEEENLMPIVVQQRTNGANAEVQFSSSNKDVASVIRKNGTYYVEFYGEGSAIITAYAANNSAVRDRVYVNVFSNEPNNLVFVDDNGNKITSKTIYTSSPDDDKYYEIKYKLIAHGEQTEQSSDTQNVNCNNVKIVDYSTVPTLLNMTEQAYKDSHENNAFSETAFDEIILDKNNNTLRIRKNVNRDAGTSFEDSVGYITLQTYILDENGNEVSSGTYTIFVNIIKTSRIALELEVSNEPSFSSTQKVLYSSSDTPLDWEGVENIIRPTVLYFSFGGEVRSLYYKVWDVWNNGDRELVLSPKLTTTPSQQRVAGDEAIMIAKSDPGEDEAYYVLRITDAFIVEINSGSCTDETKASEFTAITVTKNDISVSLTFRCLSIDNTQGLYEETDGVYNFNYWDDRFISNKTITDRAGNIIGFVS